MDINVETRIKLDAFKLRPYQEPLWDALENKGYKKIIAIWPRRAGKDICVFNLLIRAAIKRVGVYWYIWPTYNQGRKGLFDGMTNEGRRVLDYIPPEIIASINQQEQKIRLVNGSLIQVVGSESMDRLVGANPIGCIFTEFALQDPRCRQLILPILRNNGGFQVYLSTPRGKNSLWELWNIAQANPKEWFSQMLTVEDTQHISIEEIMKDIENGEISEDLARQEYWCSFSIGIEGSIYGRYMDKMRSEGRIGFVPYEPGLKVHVSFDWGVADPMVFIFYQVAGNVIRIIDYYENTRQPVHHYARYLQDKEYTYGKIFPPHDIMVEEATSGMTRKEKFEELGITLETPTWVGLDDGIEHVRTTLPKVWIDEGKCKKLIRALDNYRYEFDHHKKVYKAKPLHDQFSHACDAIRYFCTNLHRLSDDTTPEQLRERYNKARLGAELPLFFQDRFSR